MFVAHPAYLREKARELRTERRLSLLEIAERLALPKTTIFYWIRDLADPEIKHRNSPGRRRARDTAAGATRPSTRHSGTPRISRAGMNIKYMFQYHADQDPAYLVRFWSFGLGVDPALITPQRKSNSGQLRHRTWRSKHGVLTVRASDTVLRMRLQAWIDRRQDGWLDSLYSGV
jgi:hypothetical protein